MTKKSIARNLMAAACTGAFLMVSHSSAAHAQVSPLMGTWDAIAVVNGYQVPVRYVLTAGNAVTRRAAVPNGTAYHNGVYEIVGFQLHIKWFNALHENCIMHFSDRNTF